MGKLQSPKQILETCLLTALWPGGGDPLELVGCSPEKEVEILSLKDLREMKM